MCGTGDRQLALVVEHAGGADGGEHHRKGRRLSQHRGARVDAADVAEDARLELDLIEGRAVPPERVFALAAALEVTTGSRRELPTGDAREVLDADATGEGPYAV